MYSILTFNVLKNKILVKITKNVANSIVHKLELTGYVCKKSIKMKILIIIISAVLIFPLAFYLISLTMSVIAKENK
tara:strand:+ start:2193 stop:2420 length:228 start_codon:yes stop_codon:yes gene_type:complete